MRQCVQYSAVLCGSAYGTALYCAAVRTVQCCIVRQCVQYSAAGNKMQLAGRQFSSRLVTADCHVNRTVTTSNECYIQGEIKSEIKFGE